MWSTYKVISEAIGILIASGFVYGLTKHLLQDEEHALDFTTIKRLSIISASLSVVFSYGLIYGNPEFSLTPASLLIAIGFVAMLCIVAVVDAKTRYIYDQILSVFSVLNGFLLFGVYGFDFNELMNHGLGLVYGGVFYGLIYLVSKWFYKQEAFGMGDVFLLMAIGLVQGRFLVLMTGFIAFYIAVIYIVFLWVLGGRKGLKEMMPFGPFICLSAWLVSGFSEHIVMFYFKLIGLE